MTCPYFCFRILWMKYSASRNKNNFWLNLWAKFEFANGVVNIEPGNHFINILFSPCLCKEVSNPKEMRSGICPWPLKVWAGSGELCWQTWQCTWDSCYQGCFINSHCDFCCMSFHITQAAEPFLGQFLDSCSSQAGLLRQTGAGAFFKCQTGNNSGLRAYFTAAAVFLAILVHVFPLCNKTPAFSRSDKHKLYTYDLWVTPFHLWTLCLFKNM